MAHGLVFDALIGEAQLFHQLPGDGVIGIMPTREKHRVRFLEERLNHSRQRFPGIALPPDIRSHLNAQLTAGQVRRVCRMTPAAERLLRASYDALGLSARAHDRILRVARTVADLAGKSLLDEDSLLEALQYRAQEKVEL